MNSKTKRLLLLLIGPLCILLAAALDLSHTQWRDNSLPTRAQEAEIQEENSILATTSARLLRIVDGDTIAIQINGTEEKVRLIGINAPESVDPRRPVECFGKEASTHMKTLLSGQSIRLAYDNSQGHYDKYGRLLAYVFRDDNLFINDAMIRDGYAYEYTYHTPYFYQKQFRDAEHSARTSVRGLWAPQTCGGKL